MATDMLSKTPKVEFAGYEDRVLSMACEKLDPNRSKEQLAAIADLVTMQALVRGAERGGPSLLLCNSAGGSRPIRVLP